MTHVRWLGTGSMMGQRVNVLLIIQKDIMKMNGCLKKYGENKLRIIL